MMLALPFVAGTGEEELQPTEIAKAFAFPLFFFVLFALHQLVEGALLLPVTVFVLHPGERGLAWVYAGIAAFVVWAHRGNIRRLIARAERRF